MFQSKPLNRPDSWVCRLQKGEIFGHIGFRLSLGYREDAQLAFLPQATWADLVA